MSNKVSILTQPEGWVLRDGGRAGERLAGRVSILTQPEGWVLQ